MNKYYKEIRSKCPPEMVDFFSGQVRSRLEDNWDFVGSITGPEGVGKSTLANLGCSLIDPDFDLKKNVLYSPDAFELSDMVLDMKPYSAINADEAINILYKFDFMTKMQKALNKLYATCRKRNLASMFCMPDFTDLNKFFQRRTHAWIHVVDRGYAVVMVKDRNFISKDRWGLKLMDRVMQRKFGYKKKFSTISNEDILNVLRNSPCYLTEFKFPEMPVQMFKDYQKNALEAGKEFDLNNESHSKSELNYRMLCECVSWLHNEFKVTQPLIGNKLGLGKPAVNAMLAKVKGRRIDKRFQ